MKTCWLFIFLLPAVLSSNNNKNSNDDESFEMLTRGMKEYFHSNGTIIPNYFVKALKSHQFPYLFRHTEEMQNVYDNAQVCFLCELAVDLVIEARRAGLNRETILNSTEFICAALGIENQRVCDGAISLNVDVFLYIIDNRETLTGKRICSIMMQEYNCPSDQEDFSWTIKLAEGNTVLRPELSNKEPLKILHLSDLHYDPFYTPNGKADCDEPICCQSDQGEPSPGEAACGYWTEYNNSDSPWHLLEEVVRQVKTHKFDLLYYTGDIISHRVWQTSVETNKASIEKFYKYMGEQFSDVPKYYIMGNHESHPINLWVSKNVDSDQFSSQWLLDLISEYYSNDTEAKETLRTGGYFTTLSDLNPKFRIIGLNTNVAYTANFWLLYDDVDPYNQLQWLADTLKKAEDNGEYVHIMYHVPFGVHSMIKVWNREYNKILHRFANTIVGQFCGHTHRDQFTVFYNVSDYKQAIGTIFNGASITPYSQANPSYKIYSVDPETFQLLDYEEWTFNLTLANSKPSTEKPDWYKLYSFREAYNVTSLEPDQIDSVLYNMAQNHNLLDDYFRFKVRNGDAGIQNGCDTDCQKGLLCEIATAQFGDDTQCKYFSELYDQNMN